LVFAFEGRAVDDALELADIARPGMGVEVRQGQGGKAGDRLAVRRGKTLREEIGQQGKVVAALAQRWNGEANGDKAIAKVSPESGGSGEFAQWLVGAEEELPGNGVHGMARMLTIEPLQKGEQPRLPFE
jgi:hypothetical protein